MGKLFLAVLGVLWLLTGAARGDGAPSWCVHQVQPSEQSGAWLRVTNLHNGTTTKRQVKYLGKGCFALKRGEAERLGLGSAGQFLLELFVGTGK